MAQDQRLAAQHEADRLIAAGIEAETAGNLRGACEQYRKAVDAAPGYAKAQLNLGIGKEALGDADGAIESFEAALAIDPASAGASYNLGRLFSTRGALAEAARLLQSALLHKPEFPEARVVLSDVYDAQGDVRAAVTELEIALEQRPGWCGALLNYGIVLGKLGRSKEAEAALRRALAIDPDNPDACVGLANALCSRGELEEAERLLRKALEHKPVFPEAHFALSDVYDSRGDLDAAATSLERALEQRPDWAAALNNYGQILQRLQRLTEAEAALRRAIAVAPRLSIAHQTLGAVLVNQSRVPEALEVFRLGRECDPGSFDLESAELFTLNLSDDISGDALYARHVAFGARIEKAHLPRFEPFHNDRDAQRRLRIGYVSGDFCNHAVTLFTAALVERHDRSAHEIFCYSVGPIVDDHTRALQRRADVWRAGAAMSHAELADTINRDGVDILVDLAGHSGRSQLTVFAQQPAPIQVSWLGYLSTTGMTRIQYRLCDRYTDPSGAEELHTETLVRLPHSQWCYRPRETVDYTCPAIPPFEENGFVTFGSFNHVPKLSESVRRLWAEILTQLPDSRLVLVGIPDGHAREGLIAHFENAGIAASRITVVRRVGIQEYFRWFNAVDIALDTTPYSGATTTCDALWMSVPVITAPGRKPLSRSAAGILSVMGLDAWVASSPEDYVRRAVGFARAGDVLANLRKTLRQRLRASPIMDEARFTRDVEVAYRSMWRAWCAGATQP